MTEKKRQLIFVWPYVEWGGAQVYLLAIMKVARFDWDIVVMLPRDSPPDILGYIENIGVRYEFIDASLDSTTAAAVKEKLRRQWRRFHAEITILRHLKRYDLRSGILHIETLPWQSWQFLTALSLRGANVFVTLHNALGKLPVWREMILKTRMRFVSRLPGFHIFTSNHDTKNKFRGWVSDKFWEKIKVTYTCVNPPEIRDALSSTANAAEIRGEFGIEDNKFVVLCVGQFIDRKGRWVFLDAAKIVSKAHRDVIFVWLTPKEPAQNDIARIADYGLADNFRLILSKTVGHTRKDVLRFFRIADIFALPSYVEGLPIALLEAMAMGIASISTNVNAIPEAVINLETGILINPGDGPALAQAVIDLKFDEDLRQGLGARGQTFVLENFDERIASQIAIAAYKECFPDGR